MFPVSSSSEFQPIFIITFMDLRALTNRIEHVIRSVSFIRRLSAQKRRELAVDLGLVASSIRYA